MKRITSPCSNLPIKNAYGTEESLGSCHRESPDKSISICKDRVYKSAIEFLKFIDTMELENVDFLKIEY